MDRKTLDILDKSGISFAANIAVPGGGTNIFLKPDEVEDFVNDKETYAAKCYGVSKELYLEWVASDGTVQCSANNKSGGRCKNMVSGAIQQDIEDWLKMRGGYCAVHGGEGSHRK